MERLPQDRWEMVNGQLRRDGLCPIQVNERRPNIDYTDPAEDEGLTNEQVGMIMNAADGLYWPLEWVRNIRVWFLRRRLIKHLKAQ